MKALGLAFKVQGLEVQTDRCGALIEHDFIKLQDNSHSNPGICCLHGGFSYKKVPIRH